MQWDVRKQLCSHNYTHCDTQAYIRNFGEEVVRGQPAFVLAMLLRWLSPALRETAGVSSWQVRRRRRVVDVAPVCVESFMGAWPLPCGPT